jgi:outer membrane receptor protein involved in Fe transport
MFNRRFRRSSLKTSAAAIALLAFSAPGVSFAQTAKYSFDIPSQDISSALIEYGRAARQQLVFDGTTLKDKHSARLIGEYSAQEGLHRLLEGTGLRAEFAGSGAVRIVDASDPQPGSAAGDGADQGTVQALVVTAQKREEDIQDVPIAMSAFTQEDLTRSQVAGGPDLITQVPNMTFTKTNFSSYSIQIRGIGTQAISATTDAAVAVAFNNTPFIRNRFFEQEFYDLQRVEVLRGPQGTLYGRNATAGVVNIISAKPSFRYEAKLSADIANYSSHRLEGMVNMPLVEDKVALRIAGAWTKRDGYDTNSITGNPIDGRDLWSTRVSLRVEPTDQIRANLIWEHFEENDDRLRSGKQLCSTHEVTSVGGIPVSHTSGFEGGPGLQGVFSGIQATFSQGCAPASLYSPDSFRTPNGLSLPYYLPLGSVFLPTALFDPYQSRTQSTDLRTIESTVDPEYRAKSDLVEIQLNLDLGHDLTLTSETAYGADALFSLEDFNRFNTAQGAWGDTTNREGVIIPGPNGGIFCDPQIGCSDRLVAEDLSTAKSRQFSEELRLSSNYDGPFNFSLGTNFLRYDTEDKYYVFINSLSLISAIAPYGSNQPLSPYVGGVTDNRECLQTGRKPEDPTKVYVVPGCTYIDTNPIGSLNDQGHNYFLSKNPYKLISYAVFGEAYYNVTDNLKVTGGLRWTVDKKEAPRIPSWLLASASVGYPVAEVIRQEWSKPTGRLAIDWKPDLSFTDQTLVYASLARGYKAGGANPPGYVFVYYGTQTATQSAQDTSSTRPKTFAPEYVNAIEVGAKNTLLEDRATLNMSAFYYDYKGYQISEIVDRSAFNHNYDATVWGLELEADWRPLKNLRFGFKGGYENTRLANGSKAVDLMDRTAGNPDWVVVRPFPTFASSCILPVEVYAYTGHLLSVGNVGGGGLGGCELAYIAGVDPVTQKSYVPDPVVLSDGVVGDPLPAWEGYPGFNPLTAPNHGEGFDKDISGNELPNAPHFTATITADYTIPLPSDWLLTLHSDAYYQSEAWTRIFNTPGYDKLKAYTNVNLAAIFTNEDAGWRVMAYVKNVFDRTSITGAFLNSDDTGLTTNVFLTEPRLYGLKVTRDWSGGAWWTGVGTGHKPGDPYALTVELGGQIQRQDAPYQSLAPDFANAFSQAIDPRAAQQRDLDWGDGRDVTLMYRPAGSPWTVSAGLRHGRTNSGITRLHREEASGPKACSFPIAGIGSLFCDPNSSKYSPYNFRAAMDWSDASAVNREEHTLVDFEVGRDLGVGAFNVKSSLALGLRYAQFRSSTDATMYGIPDWEHLPDGWANIPVASHYYGASLAAARKFKGAGPTLSWDASKRLLGDELTGHVDLDWSATGGVLFGKQWSAVGGFEQRGEFLGTYNTRPRPAVAKVPFSFDRSGSATVPLLDLAVGVSYEVQRFKLSTGYRWERYFNVLDAGYAEREDYDRTIDGPYFKIAVGFGG